MSFRPLHVMSVCTEWLPHHGGLPQFNRSLSIALRRNGHRVTCLVERMSDADEIDAERAGVQLIVPEIRPGLRNIMAPVKCDPPDVLIGHDRRTGEAAAYHAYVHYGEADPPSACVMVAHTSPDEIEVFTQEESRSLRAETRFEELRRLCAVADVVCAVGPRLQRKIGGMLDDGWGGRRIVRLDPGLAEFGNDERRVPGPECICLVVGRSRHKEVKGFDIASAAFGQISEATRKAFKPTLWIRGAETGAAEHLRAALVRDGQLNRGDLVVREYAPQAEVVGNDLRRASVLLMPSRAEGFGLVGLEALSLGTPVLLSDRSGLSELLSELAGAQAAPFIVEVTDEMALDVPRWRDAVEATLLDRDASLRRTRELLDVIRPHLTWDSTVNQLVAAVGDHRDETSVASARG